MGRRYFIQDYTLSNLANTIREQGQLDNVPMNVTQMPSYIRNGTVPKAILDGTLSSITNNTSVLRPYAFFRCDNLIYGSFPQCIEVGISAFRNTPIKELYLPKCETYGQSAFDGCTSLEKLTIGVSVLSKGTETSDLYTILNSAANLREVHLPKCTAIYSSVFSNNPLLSVVDAPVADIITKHAFYNCDSLEEINLPNAGATTAYGIGTEAFRNCSNLKRAYLPLIKSMNAYAFSGTALEEFYAPQLVGTSSLPFGAVGSTASGGVMTFKSVTIGYATVPATFSNQANLVYFSASNATSIAARAFQNCKSLTEHGWHLGTKGLTTIGESAFQNTGVQILSDQFFPGTTACILTSTAFFSCASLTKVDAACFVTLSSRTFGNCTALSEVNLPNVSVITIGTPASGTGPFVGCTNLHTLSLPALTVIPAYGFYALSSLSSLYIPNCTSISQYGTYNCADLTELDGPEVVYFGHYNLQGTNISQVFLPKTSYVGKYGFSNAVLESIYAPLWSTAHASGVFSAAAKTTLKYLNMGYATAPVYSAYVGLRSFIAESCTTLARYAFYGCTSLYTVSLPECKTVASQAFQGCTALPSITLPAATKISASAFSGCTNFSIITLGNASVCALANVNAFANTGITATTGSIRVPSDWVASYKAATNWSTFADRIFAI